MRSKRAAILRATFTRLNRLNWSLLDFDFFDAAFDAFDSKMAFVSQGEQVPLDGGVFEILPNYI